ncbi:FimV/HubP family polar landmark protein [Roseateles sp.]|uniref:FimV/HubP family polar landmark protein n=1 Tax=Roseateles sp. TaxID=1971397 RepID=UPI00286BFCE3|nr:FimV/HubP family polar landmark protein [Roseateles sp.]
MSHIAAAALLVSGSSGAWALGLGRLSVQSALGETLKAEIDITSLSPEEAGSLKVRIAPPESYRATGVEYNSVLTSTQVQVLKKDGRSVLRVSSDRAVQEPFVDVILELTWANGRLVREYTLLFDPPAATRTNGTATPAPAAAVVTTAPVISPAPAAQTEPVPAPAATAAVPIPPSPSPVARVPRETAAPVAAPAPRAAVAAPAAFAASAASEYKVKPGDNLSRIAGRTQPEGISLDQMLVGLFRNNPDAFLDGNMNRLRSGVVLQVPASETLGSMPTAEARQVIRAQSADFSAYRLRLSSAAPTVQSDQNQRQAKGKVEAAVEDRKPAPAPPPDKLTLSKAASANADAKLAAASKEAEKKDAAARMAELTRNVEELKKISSAAKPAIAASVAAPPALVPVAPTAAPTTVIAALPALPLESAASTPGLPSTVASAPAPKPPVVASAASAALAPPLPEKAEPGWLDQLLENPLTLPLGAALLAALGGLVWFRRRGAKAAGKADTGFHESRLQPDSFFGATGGQRVDTRDATGAASSMNYSLSQLDAIGDVDPVAEADVYLAYGRDLQAEEILKEALRATPERMAIRLKLLEVYAKRRDTKGFEQLAVQLYAETSGVGDDWARAQELGRQIDPENPLYQPGGVPSQQSDGREVHPEPMDASTMPHTVGHLATEPVGRSAQAEAGPMSGFDLDLDLDLGAPAAVPPSPMAMEATQAMTTTIEQAPFSMDFDLSEPLAAPVAPAAAAPAAGNELEFDLDDFGSLDDQPLNRPVPADDGNALDFDLGSIDLSLPELPNGPNVPNQRAAEEPLPVAESLTLDADFGAEFDELMKAGEVAEPAADPLADAFDLMDDGGDPLMRQLELADEFRQIGDTEGAREVLQELISKSSGPLRDKAQAMLNDLR